MSLREETAALAVDLAGLVTSRSSRHLDPDGLAVALLARRDTLRLMRQILLTATGQPRTQAPRDRTGTTTPPGHPVDQLPRGPPRRCPAADPHHRPAAHHPDRRPATSPASRRDRLAPGCQERVGQGPPARRARRPRVVPAGADADR